MRLYILAGIFWFSAICFGIEWDFNRGWKPVEGAYAEFTSENVSLADGFAEKAAEFQGRGFIECRVDQFANTDQLTIRAVVKLTGRADGIGNYIVSLSQSSEPDVLVYGLRTIGGCAQFIMRYKKADGFSYKGVQSVEPLPLNKWVAVTAVKDSDQMRLYINGSQAAVRTAKERLLAADTLSIGRETAGTRKERNLSGFIDELEIIPRATVPEEIIRDYIKLSSGALKVISDNGTHYFSFHLPAKDPRFPDSPARMDVDINYLEAMIGGGVDLDPQTLEVFQWDKKSGKPLRAVDCRNTYDLADNSARVYWKGEGNASYAVAVREYGDDLKQKERIPLIGAGEPVSVGSSELYADLGQGLAGYPVVVDWDLDGDKDLIVSFVIPRRVFLFENVSDEPGAEPDFLAPKMIWQGRSLLTFDVTQEPDGEIYAFTVKKKNAGLLWENEQNPFIELQISKSEQNEGQSVLEDISTAKVYGLAEEANVFDITFQDINGDGVKDLVMGVLEGIWWWPDGLTPWNGGIGNPKVGYGKGYDSTNKWLGSAPIGSVYVALNNQSNVSPQFSKAQLLKVDGEPVKMPTTQIAPSFVDMNQDGKLDLLLAVGVDDILLYYNKADKKGDIELSMPVNALKAAGVSKWSYFDSRFEITDWNSDGTTEIIMCSNPGVVVKCGIDGDKLVEEKILKCKGGNLWADSLIVPSIADLDNNGKWDIILGDASGYLSYFANDGSNLAPLFPSREKLAAAGQVFHPVAGYSGSIQGPSEARWGYLAPNICDWDNDGDLDALISDITGYVYWLCNIAETKGEYEFASPIPLKVGTWPLKVRWRTRPCVIPGDRLPNMITTDPDGFLALYERNPVMGESGLKDGQRLTDEAGNEIKIDGPGGYNGRNKFYTVDWNRDGVMDIICGQAGRSGINKDLKFDMPREPRATAALLINIGTNKLPVYKAAQTLKLANGENIYFGTHSCAPAVYDYDGDGWDDLFIGAETGWVHCYNRSLFEDASQFLKIPVDIGNIE